MVVLSSDDARDLVTGRPVDGYTRVADQYEMPDRPGEYRMLVVRRRSDDTLWGATYHHVDGAHDVPPFSTGDRVVFEPVVETTVTRYQRATWYVDLDADREPTIWQMAGSTPVAVMRRCDNPDAFALALAGLDAANRGAGQ